MLRRKWFTYEVFKKIKYGKEGAIQNCKEDDRKDQKLGDKHSYFDEKVKKKEESKTNNVQSISSIKNNKT